MPDITRQKQLLQRVVACLAIIPVAAGLYGVLFGLSLTGDVASISAESHFRYMSGLLLGIGICFWSTVPEIERKSRRFRLLTLLVVIGGLGRLAGLMMTGLPSVFMIGALIIELIVTPALCLWQAHVANVYADALGVADD